MLWQISLQESKKRSKQKLWIDLQNEKKYSRRGEFLSPVFSEKNSEKSEKRFDIRVWGWYTISVNKEEVPLLTLWHEQIGLIQYSKQG